MDIVEITQETIRGYSKYTIEYGSRRMPGWGTHSAISDESARRQVGASAQVPIQRYISTLQGRFPVDSLLPGPSNIEAQKIDYLDGDIFYAYCDNEQIATVNEGTIVWEDDEEPWRGAAAEVEAAVAEAE